MSKEESVGGIVVSSSNLSERGNDFLKDVLRETGGGKFDKKEGVWFLVDAA